MRLITFSIMSLVLLACSKPEEVVASKTGDVLIPLETGNYWTYQLEDFIGLNMPGLIDSTIVRVGDKNTISVNGDEYEFFEQLEYHTALENFPQAVPLLTMVRNGESGFEYLSAGTIESIYPYPTLEDYSWTRELEIDSSNIWTQSWVVKSTDTLISIPLGEFNCIQYEMVLTGVDTSIHSYFYAPGVGKIAEEYVFGRNLLEPFRTVLIDYNLE